MLRLLLQPMNFHLFGKKITCSSTLRSILFPSHSQLTNFHCSDIQVISCIKLKNYKTLDIRTTKIYNGNANEIVALLKC